MGTQDIPALIERLRYFNAWRRGAEGEQPNQEQIGRDIDAAVAIFTRQTRAPDPLSQALNEGDEDEWQLNRCETCAYWRKPTEEETWGVYGLGHCLIVPLLYDATDWTDDRTGRVILDDYKDTKAFVLDGKGYCGLLLTRSDFGCVNYGPDTQ